MDSINGQSSTRLCAVCSIPARYTCPRCSTSTCSLPCSRAHKFKTGCSGERNKAAYVQMNAYGWGTMMRDYCFLEEVGRKASTWGDQIARGGFATAGNAKVKDMRGRGGARAASARGKGGRGVGSSKRDLLKAHLDALDIEMDDLPIGMQRRKVNQSTLDPKTQAVLLTIQFTLYPPQPSSSSAASAPYTILSHRNPIHSSIIDLLRRHVHQHPSFNQDHSKHRKENICPDWATSLVHPHPDDPEAFKVPQCYLPAQINLSNTPYYSDIATRRGPYYHRFCPSQTLQELLQGTHFTEFPAIHVYDPDSSAFIGNVVTKQGHLLSENEHNLDSVTKRRKLNTKAGRKAISGLLGDYGSDSDSESEKAVASRRRDELRALGSYSENESGDKDSAVEVRNAEVTDFFSDDEAERPELDSPDLLELIKQVRGTADHDAEVVDWGDDWDEDI